MAASSLLVFCHALAQPLRQRGARNTSLGHRPRDVLAAERRRHRVARDWDRLLPPGSMGAASALGVGTGESRAGGRSGAVLVVVRYPLAQLLRQRGTRNSAVGCRPCNVLTAERSRRSVARDRDRSLPSRSVGTTAVSGVGVAESKIGRRSRAMPAWIVCAHFTSPVR